MHPLPSERHLTPVILPWIYIMYQKVKQLDYGGGPQKNLTQSGSHTMRSILMSHMLVTKDPQNVHRKYSYQFWLPSYVRLKLPSISVNLILSIYFFVNPLHSPSVFWYLTCFDNLMSFDTLTHYLNHLSLSQGFFWHFDIWPVASIPSA